MGSSPVYICITACPRSLVNFFYDQSPYKNRQHFLAIQYFWQFPSNIPLKRRQSTKTSDVTKEEEESDYDDEDEGGGDQEQEDAKAQFNNTQTRHGLKEFR